MRAEAGALATLATLVGAAALAAPAAAAAGAGSEAARARAIARPLGRARARAGAAAQSRRCPAPRARVQMDEHPRHAGRRAPWLSRLLAAGGATRPCKPAGDGRRSIAWADGMKAGSTGGAHGVLEQSDGQGTLELPRIDPHGQREAVGHIGASVLPCRRTSRVSMWRSGSTRRTHRQPTPRRGARTESEAARGVGEVAATAVGGRWRHRSQLLAAS